MPRSEYTSLSIHNEDYDRMRRNFDRLVNAGSFTTWHTAVVEAAFQRLEFLKKSYPDIRLIAATDEGLVLEDTKTKKLVKVFRDGNKISCNDDNKDYVIYALMHPEFF